jgi:hypothetical protein
MKKKVGRPTKFNKLNLEKVKLLAEKGFTDLELCKFYDVSERAWNNWKHKHPEFMQFLKEGKAKADEDVERSLFERATGYTCREAHEVISNGECHTLEVVKQLPPATTACIFWLKNRNPEKWRDKHNVEHENNISLGELLKDLEKSCITIRSSLVRWR